MGICIEYCVMDLCTSQNYNHNFVKFSSIERFICMVFVSVMPNNRPGFDVLHHPAMAVK